MATVPHAVRVKTTAGWQDLAIVGPQGPQGATGSTGPKGDTGAMTVYNQPAEPAGAVAGDVWIDTDAPVPVVANVMTYRQLSALGAP